ncbi:hypothetical protein JMJ77_0014191, partial [Colletotrichum scovillei]
LAPKKDRSCRFITFRPLFLSPVRGTGCWTSSDQGGKHTLSLSLD